MTYQTADPDPWTGQMRKRIARATAWCRSVAVAIELGRVEVPTPLEIRPGQRSTDPASTLRATARELFRGDCLATRPALGHVSDLYEALSPHLPEKYQFDD